MTDLAADAWSEPPQAASERGLRSAEKASKSAFTLSSVLAIKLSEHVVQCRMTLGHRQSPVEEVFGGYGKELSWIRSSVRIQKCLDALLGLFS